MIKNIKQNLKRKVLFFIGIYNFYYFRLVETKKIKNADLVFFFPYYHTGGAEKVHLNIVKALEKQNIYIIFTHLSATKNYHSAFKTHANIVEINNIKNKKSAVLNKFLENKILKTINKSKSIHSVFGSNTDYFYQLLPKIKSDIYKVDLIHALSENDPRELQFVNSCQFIDSRICINTKAKEDLISIYNNNKLSKKLSDKLVIIQNGVDVNKGLNYKKDDNRILKFGFIGRWSAEKRPEIFLDVAKEIIHKYPKVEFVMAGTGMKSNLSKIENSGVSFLGEITDPKKLDELYKSLTAVVITSVYEGFPMVIMESMIFGTIPIATNVGGISQHINHMKNGLLISSEHKASIVERFVENISYLIENEQHLKIISTNANNYALDNFNIDKFNTSYQVLFRKKP